MMVMDGGRLTPHELIDFIELDIRNRPEPSGELDVLARRAYPHLNREGESEREKALRFLQRVRDSAIWDELDTSERAFNLYSVIRSIPSVHAFFGDPEVRAFVRMMERYEEQGISPDPAWIERAQEIGLDQSEIEDLMQEDHDHLGNQEEYLIVHARRLLLDHLGD